MTSITIPNSVTSIGSSAFSGCTSLTSVTIGNGVTSIGGSAFSYCTSLTAITVDALNPNYSSVDGVLFNKSQTTLIQYPGAKDGSYIVPNSVSSIGDEGFASCTRLTSITIPNGVSSIGDRALSGCTSLTAITVDALNPRYSSVDGVLFDGGQTTLIQYPGAKAGSYTIPNSVTSIGSGAFSSCTGLTRVRIPDSVTDIGWWGAFSACTSLTSVTIPNSITRIGWGAFSGCTSLTSVTIPDSVTWITSAAFSECTRLTEVYFQGNAPVIREYVFGGDDATVYYLPGSKGWDTTFANLPTALWLPKVQTSDAYFGVWADQFGFTINWTSGMTVAVEASTSLANPSWVPLETHTLKGDSWYFSDPDWANYPSRFYRVRSP